MADWIEEGAKAPDFTLVTHEVAKLKLSSLRGAPVVLYFYPKDDTPGCTKEACGFRDAYEELLARDTEVIGVSYDSAASHGAFAEKHRLPFPLLPDTDRSLAKAYGADSFFGSLLNMSSRVTFLIGKDGKIAGVFRSLTNIDHHVGGIRDAVKALEGRSAGLT